MLCPDARTGAVVWQKDLTQDFGSAESCGSTPSLLLEGHLLILVIGAKPDACVLALDEDTGNEVWRALDDSWTYSSPIVITAGGQRQLIVLTPEALTSLNPATGKTWWREKCASRGDFTAACPVVRDLLLFAGGVMFQLDADKPGASVLWPEVRTSDTRRVLSQTSVPMIKDGCVFSDKSYGHLVCLEAKTGKLLWQNEDVTDKVNGAAQQFFPNGDAVLIFTNQGNLIRVRLRTGGLRRIEPRPFHR